MGRSNSVNKLLEEEKKNRERLEQISRDLITQQKNAESELQADQIQFYTNSQRTWKYSSYVTGANSDFQLSDTWSLENLKKIIDQITNAVVGTVTGTITGLPEGTTASPDATKTNASGGLTEDTRLMIAANCLNLLSGLINSFGHSSKIQVSTAKSSVPLGQGLRIFASVACNVSQERSFFNNKIMSCYRYCYNVNYSLDEFSEQAERTLVAQYELTLNALNTAAKLNYDNFVSKQIDIRQYMETADYIEEKPCKSLPRSKH
nr:hypothetical protein [Pseudomonas sp. BIGb0427]